MAELSQDQIAIISQWSAVGYQPVLGPIVRLFDAVPRFRISAVCRTPDSLSTSIEIGDPRMGFLFQFRGRAPCESDYCHRVATNYPLKEFPVVWNHCVGSV
jgi:hypothetical protein